MKALDSAYILMYILEYKYCFYQNKKRWLLKNILVICDFDMRFWFILPNWKRSTYDSKIFKDTINKKGFVIPNKKYWLANAGYLNFNHLFTSYKSIYYHLKK